MNRALGVLLGGVVVIAAGVGGAFWYRSHARLSVEPEPLPIVKRGIVITTTAVSLDGARLFELPPLAEQAQGGAGASLKARGPNDLEIVPLKNALQRRPAFADEQSSGMRVELAAETPYRTMIEVLFTLGQSKISSATLSMRTPGSKRPIEIYADFPRALSERGESMAFFLVHDGIKIKFHGRNIAPGCSDAAEGVAVPKRDDYDLAGLVACIRALNVEAYGVAEDSIILANPGEPVLNVLQVASAARCGEPSCEGRQPGSPFMRRTSFGIPR
jgi:hypothetical protein